MPREQTIMHQIMAAAGRIIPGTRVFRNNVGQAWAGKHYRAARKQWCELHPGDVVVRSARPLHAGLCPGSSDLIGWTPITITADMVGNTHAVFTAIECKTGTGRTSDKQKNFIEAVRAAGGIAGVARNESDVHDMLKSGAE